MQNFTPNSRKKPMFTDSSDMAEHLEQEKIQMGPRASVVGNILAYNRALSMRPSKHLERIQIVLN